MTPCQITLNIWCKIFFHYYSHWNTCQSFPRFPSRFPSFLVWPTPSPAATQRASGIYGFHFPCLWGHIFLIGPTNSSAFCILLQLRQPKQTWLSSSYVNYQWCAGILFSQWHWRRSSYAWDTSRQFITNKHLLDMNFMVSLSILGCPCKIFLYFLAVRCYNVSTLHLLYGKTGLTHSYFKFASNYLLKIKMPQERVLKLESIELSGTHPPTHASTHTYTHI